jgi:fatty acid desaturase
MGMNVKVRQSAPKDTGQVKRHTVEWPTIGLVFLSHAAWFALGYWVYPIQPFLALVLMPFAIALHSSLQHEALHGHPTRNALVNEALVFFPLGLFYPYRRFKAMHLKHHHDERLTDPYDDPESYYRAAMDWERLPVWFKRILELNNTMAGRFLLGPALMAGGFAWAELKLALAGDKKVQVAWGLHFLGMLPVYLVVTTLFGMPFWLYLLVPAYFGLALITVRTYAEHRWSESLEGRTIIVERSSFAFLFLNNNLHIVHHKNPNAAWYRLPQLFRERREEWIGMNGGYVFKGYFDLFRAYGFKRKEPNVHPVLRRGGREAGE